MVPLLDLEIIGKIAFDRRIAPLLPYLSSLTSLRIHLVDRFDTELDSLFVVLPLLQKLDLRTIGTITVFASTTVGSTRSHSIEATKAAETRLRQAQDASAKALPLLRILIVENSRVDQAQLEVFLARTIRLQELRLIDLLSVSRTVYPQVPLLYDAPRLLQHLWDLSLPLQTLHISIFGEDIPEPLQKEFDMLTPGSRELIARELLPSRIQTMEQLQNTITTLNLFGTKVCGMDDNVLHHYLCTSPHLLHLKAVDTAYLVNHFDIQRRMASTRSALSTAGEGADGGDSDNGGGISDSGNKWQPGIWKCRKLRTLHLGFYALDPHNTYALATSQHAQILFGYISLVCPFLEDLFIHGRENLETTHMNHSVNLEPGLFLLTRLRFLMVLKVGRAWRRMLKFNNYRPQECQRPTMERIEKGGDDGDGTWTEFKWMIPEGQSRAARVAHRKSIESWQESIKCEEIINLSLQSEADDTIRSDPNSNSNTNSNGSNSLPAGAGNGRDAKDTALGEALRDLGLIADVKAVFGEMDKTEKGYVVWPEMRRVSIFSETPFGLPVEKEYLRIIAQR